MNKKTSSVKKRVVRMWSFILAFLSGISTLFITGCYLAYLPAPSLDITGKVMDFNTTNNIANIRIKLLNSSMEEVGLTLSVQGTNDNYIIRDYNPSAGTYTIIAEDIDDTTNGLYSPATNILNSPGSDYYTNINIFLKP